MTTLLPMNNRHSRKRPLLIPALFALTASFALHAQEATDPEAAPPWYQVEVLLFESTAMLDPDNEQFAQDITSPQQDGTQRLTPLPQPAGETEPALSHEPARPIAPLTNAPAADKETPPETPGSTTAEQPFQLLSPEQFTLTAEELAIRRSTRYVLLGHLAWRQPVLEHEQTQPVWIDTLPPPEPSAEPTTGTGTGTAPGSVKQGAGEQVADKTGDGMASNTTPDFMQPLLGPLAAFRAHDTLSNDADTSSTTAEATAAPAAPEPVVLEADNIRGRLAVSLSRYLHVTTDLVLQRQHPEESGQLEPLSAQPGDQTLPLVTLTTTASTTATATEDGALSTTPETVAPVSPYLVYQMTQKRRVRSGELHYFDHPAFGLLIKLTPYEPNPPKPEPAGAKAAL